MSQPTPIPGATRMPIIQATDHCPCQGPESSAARPRSTPALGCEVPRRTTTAGRRRDLKAGRSRTCCRTSAEPSRIHSAGSSTGWTARFLCGGRRPAISVPSMRLSRRRLSGWGFRWSPTSTAPATKRPAIGPRPQNVADGIRMNAAFTYLASARTRTNLAVLPNTLVDRILIEDGRATGVRAADGNLHHATEVVLAAGAYGSPAILMRSGIGPEAHLRDVGVAVAAHRPGVGEHLLDHPLVIEGLGEYRVKVGPPSRRTSPHSCRSC